MATGTVASVDTAPLGDNLTAAAAIGDTVITVDDTTDFDGENGGTVTLGGVLYGYTTIDDDTGAISLASPLTAAAAVDDRVDVWDAAAGAAAVECRALVSMPDDVDAGDTIDAVVSIALVPLLPEGIRDPGTGETVTLEERDGEWVVTDVRGKAPQFNGAHLAPGSVPAAAMSFQVGSTTVTIAAAAPSTPAVGDLWIDTTSGNQLNQWDGTVWGPLPFGTDAIATGAITADLIAAGAIVAEKIAVGALDAASITALSLSSASISGHVVGSDISGSDFVIDADGGRILIYQLTTTVAVNQTTPGTYAWTPPTGVTAVKGECWGSGGDGSAGQGTSTNRGGNGGGGGEYSCDPKYGVTPGTPIHYTVGSHGTTGGSQNSTITDGTGVSGYPFVTATGGASASGSDPGSGGSGGTAPIRFRGANGGYGARGATGATAPGGGGGSSAGRSAAGNDGATAANLGPGAAGGVAPAGGGNGGAGSSSTVGGNGVSPGGGGGGGKGGGAAGGSGSNGRVAISYVAASNLIASIAAVAGTDDYGNAYPAGVSISPQGSGNDTQWTYFVAGDATASGISPTPPSLSQSYASGFAQGNAGVGYVQFYKDALGFVHIRGSIAATAAHAAMTASGFTLPAGWRPRFTEVFTAWETASGTAVAKWQVSTGGVLSFQAGGANTLYIPQVSFMAEQ